MRPLAKFLFSLTPPLSDDTVERDETEESMCLMMMFVEEVQAYSERSVQGGLATAVSSERDGWR